jgi:hypothetical protein
VGHDHGHLALGIHGRNHVLHERQIPLALGRDPKPKPSIPVPLGDLASPLIERKRRIGDHPVVQDQLPALDQLGLADRVALLDPTARPLVQEHVHLADAPSPEVLLLPVQRHVLRVAAVRLDVLRALDEHAAGPTGGIADPHALARGEHGDDGLDHLVGRVELAAFLARVVGEFLDQVLVGPAEHVRLAEIAVAQG